MKLHIFIAPSDGTRSSLSLRYKRLLLLLIELSRPSSGARTAGIHFESVLNAFNTRKKPNINYITDVKQDIAVNPGGALICK